jgi:membrane-associated phospholipid phosphatase
MNQLSKSAIFILLLSIILIFAIGYYYLDLAIVQMLWEKGKCLYPFFQSFTQTVDGVFGGYLFFQAAPQSKIFTLMAFRPFLLLSLFAVFYYIFEQRKIAIAFLIAAPTWLFSSFTTGLLKSFTQRPRPLSHFPIAELDSNLVQFKGVYDSFPSGHATDYAALFVPFIYLFPRHTFWLIQIPLWISVGRMVLFMHFFTDVLGSWVIVIIFTMLFYKTQKIISAWK